MGFVQTLGYWDSRYKNERREGLTTCLRKYGWGITQIFDEGKPVRTLTHIYLDESRSDGNAWGLAIHQGIFFVKINARERSRTTKYKLVKLPCADGPPNHKRNFNTLKGLYPHVAFEEMPDLVGEGEEIEVYGECEDVEPDEPEAGEPD